MAEVKRYKQMCLERRPIFQSSMFFFGKLIPPQVDKSTGVRPEIPIDDGHPPPPPHRSCPTIVCIQRCSAREGSLIEALLFI